MSPSQEMTQVDRVFVESSDRAASGDGMFFIFHTFEVRMTMELDFTIFSLRSNFVSEMMTTLAVNGDFRVELREPVEPFRFRGCVLVYQSDREASETAKDLLKRNMSGLKRSTYSAVRSTRK